MGTIAGVRADDLPHGSGSVNAWTVVRASNERSHSSILVGDGYVMKLFRRLEYGPNPDWEVTRYLSEVRRFDGVPRYAGHVRYEHPAHGTATVALLQQFVPNQGDGWRWMLDELGRYYERVLTFANHELLTFGEHASLMQLAEWEFPPGLDDALGISDDAAAALGRRTAQMHLALAEPGDDPAFAPEPFTADDAAALVTRLRDHLTRAYGRLRELLPALPDDVLEIASQVLAMRSRVLGEVNALGTVPPRGQKIRVHGDYQLRHVLRADTDFVAIDFGGDPARPLAERRAKRSAMTDVVCMLRSLSYAARSGLVTHIAHRAGSEDRLQPWARLWERSMHATFLRAYRETARHAAFLPTDPTDFAALLRVHLLDQLARELHYELDHRPAWLRVPLASIIDLALQPRAAT
jgi:maltose alpha-D-glucosyltransferase/alpha-amylase